jgi:hypothetical protein
MRRVLRGLIIGTAFVVSGLFMAARADVVHLEGGGQHRGTIVKEDRRSVTIKTAGGEIRVSRAEISRIVREEGAKDYVRRRLKELKGTDDPEQFYELGQWADEHDLPKGAKFCYRKAIEVDAFHRPSREALGHVYHQGRWYTPAEYKQVVEGLVEWEGRWVTPEEKALLEQGFVQDEQGNWIDPDERPAESTSDGGFRRDRESKPRAASADKPRRSRPSARRPRKGKDRGYGPVAPPLPWPEDDGYDDDDDEPAKDPGAGLEEDKAWYRDNATQGDFASAGHHTSKYYRIKTNVKPEYAERYGEMMDRYYVRFLKFFKNYLPDGDLPKSEIYIYSNKQEFMRATGMGQGVGGFYNTGNKRVTGYHGLFGQTGTTRTVLAHEGTHQFEDIILQGSFGNCPIWILEGLAVFFESAYYDGDEVIIGLVPRDRLASLKRGLETNTLIPLNDLIRTPQPQFTGYHYAHAWSLIYMISYYGGSKSVRKNCQQWFSDLMMDSRKGRVTAADVIERCGGPEKFQELEELWKEWLRDLPYDYDPR